MSLDGRAAPRDDIKGGVFTVCSEHVKKGGYLVYAALDLHLYIW